MDLGKNIQQSIDLYLKNFGTLFVAGLVAGLITCATVGILAGPVIGGFLVLVLKVMRGEKGEFNEIFAHFDKFAPTFVASLICFIAMIIMGIIPILNIILVLVFNPLISFVWVMALIKIIEQDFKPMDAIKEGIELVKTNPVMIWLYTFIINILSMVGSIALLIGVIFTAPLSSIGLAVAYQNMTTDNTVSNAPSINA